MIEIMDTTLKGGERASGVSLAAREKPSIARVLLNDLDVNWVETASARVSDRELETVKRVAVRATHSGNLDKLEALGFVDGMVSLGWIESAGCRVVNLLCKSSHKYVTEQLRRTPEQHVGDIHTIVLEAAKWKIDVNIYLEDWSNGIKHSPDYIFLAIGALKGLPICRFVLPDISGTLGPGNTHKYCKMMMDRYPDLRSDFRAHNDYDPAVADVYSAIRADIKGIHTAVNGLGKCTGNTPLNSVLAAIKGRLGGKTNLREEKINKANRLAETYSGVRTPPSKPIIGEHVSTQCAGVYADGDSKNNLYCSDPLPERFGQVREHASGKTPGEANIRKDLGALGTNMDEDLVRKVTERIIELGDKKETITPKDLPYIASDILHHDNMLEDQEIWILNCSLFLAQVLKPMATLRIEINGEAYKESASDDGQCDVLIRALRRIYPCLNRPSLMLTSYSISIPPGERAGAFAQIIISRNYTGVDFKTRGLDVDQTEAAIKATLKILNKIEDQ